MRGMADVEQVDVVSAPERSGQDEVDRVVVTGGERRDPDTPGEEAVEEEEPSCQRPHRRG
jgi:hypothetical protein